MNQRCLQCWQVLFLPLFLKHIVCQRRLWDLTLISFLVLWSFCLSSSLVHLRKGLEYLTSGTVYVFILLIKFLQLSFVSSSFLVLLIYSFWIYHFVLFDGSCLNFWDEACWFLSLRFFGLLSSSLLLFPQCFGRYVLRPSSGVCRIREPSRNFELRPLLKPRGSPVLIPFAMTGCNC